MCEHSHRQDVRRRPDIAEKSVRGPWRSGRKSLRESDPQFPDSRVSQELDVPDALLQLVEHVTLRLRSAAP